MNQNEEIRVLYVQPGKYPEEIKIPNTYAGNFSKICLWEYRKRKIGQGCLYHL